MLILFWISVIAIFYAYFGYPLCLLAISVFKKLNKQSNYKLSAIDYQPKVTFIITAYNEEKRIKDKIEETLLQDYPKEKLEIIVASDCSNDGTDEIVKEYENMGVRLIRSPERKGKENAQKYAVENSKGEILIFSDVATILKSDGISNIVKNFQDPGIGCVSSEDRFIDEEGKVSGEGAYVKYEMFLRNLESRVNTLVGLSGSFFAARREVCKNWATDLQSDFNTLLNSIKLNLRGISDPSSIGYYKNIVDEKKEFARKVRTVQRGIAVFFRSLALLNPFKYGLFSWQLISHKLCRWLVPVFMIIAFFTNTILAFHSPFFTATLILQAAFYSLTYFYYKRSTRNSKINVIDKEKNNKKPSTISYQLSAILKIPYFFVMANASILVAWYKYLSGNRATFWEPSIR